MHVRGGTQNDFSCNRAEKNKTAKIPCPILSIVAISTWISYLTSTIVVGTDGVPRECDYAKTPARTST